MNGLPVVPSADGRFVKVSLPDGTEVAVELGPQWVRVSQENFEGYVRFALAAGESVGALGGFVNDALGGALLRPLAFWTGLRTPHRLDPAPGSDWCARCGRDGKDELHRGIRGI